MNKMFQFIKKHFWEKWIGGVVTLLVILGIPTFLIESLKREIQFSFAWLILLFMMIIALCWGIFVEKIIQAKNSKKKEYPLYFKYTHDIFDSYKYEWLWNYDQEKQMWYLGNIISKCLTCDFELVNGLCQKCNATNVSNKSREEIRAYIRHEIEKRYNVRGIEIG